MRITGGRTVYGQDLGILMLDTVFPRLPGDVGNARTWPFPVRYLVVDGAVPGRIMGTEPDPTVLEPFIEAARQLERDGVRAITTSCGFLAIYQQELAAAVDVPVLSSALLQVPLVATQLGGRPVGILTERDDLTERHFAGAGFSASSTPVVVRAFDEDAVFPHVFIGNRLEADADELTREMVALARALVDEHPDVGAIVCECTNFVPFSQAMREATGLPVYDLHTLVTGVMTATRGHVFPRP